MPKNFFPDFSTDIFSINNISIFLQIILGVLILFLSSPAILNTFYGYFLIMFIIVMVLRTK
jgi:hypothetical protein